jgi:hypothetical protein
MAFIGVNQQKAIQNFTAKLGARQTRREVPSLLIICATPVGTRLTRANVGCDRIGWSVAPKTQYSVECRWAAPKGTRPPGGSRKGIPNRITTDVRAMILAALDRVGGQEYLVQQAHVPWRKT